MFCTLCACSEFVLHASHLYRNKFNFTFKKSDIVNLFNDI